MPSRSAAGSSTDRGVPASRCLTSHVLRSSVGENPAGGRVGGCGARERRGQRLGLQRRPVRGDEEVVRAGGDGPPDDVLPRGPARDLADPPGPARQRDAHPGDVQVDVPAAHADELGETGAAAQRQPEDREQPVPAGGGPRPGGPRSSLASSAGAPGAATGPAASPGRDSVRSGTLSTAPATRSRRDRYVPRVASASPARVVVEVAGPLALGQDPRGVERDVVGLRGGDEPGDDGERVLHPRRLDRLGRGVQRVADDPAHEV